MYVYSSCKAKEGATSECPDWTQDSIATCILHKAMLWKFENAFFFLTINYLSKVEITETNQVCHH